MKILYDLVATQPSSNAKVHGGGNYGIIVFFELLRNNCEIECLIDSRKYLRPDISKAIGDNNLPVHDVASTSIEDVLKKGNFDVFYSALVFSHIGVPDNTRFVGTIHGLREIEMPHDREMLKYRMSTYQKIRSLITYSLGRKWKNVLLKRTRKILLNPRFEYVTVSEHTKYSIVSYFPEISPDNILVCYSPSTVSMDDDVELYSESKYIMLVSGNRPEKNALRAVKALDEIFAEFPVLKAEYRVVIAGCKPDSFHYKIKNIGNFEMPGYVDDKTLVSMYKGATIFAYPSLNEGFGYPPLEAMRFGVPVVASPITSIAEVCGDAALYFNPFDYKEIKGRLLRMMLDENVRTEYSKRSLLRFEIIKEKQQKDLQKLVSFIMGK
jgi:glycosyl transferase, putative